MGDHMDIHYNYLHDSIIIDRVTGADACAVRRSLSHVAQLLVLKESASDCSFYHVMKILRGSSYANRIPVPRLGWGGGGGGGD